MSLDFTVNNFIWM